MIGQLGYVILFAVHHIFNFDSIEEAAKDDRRYIGSMDHLEVLPNLVA